MACVEWICSCLWIIVEILCTSVKEGSERCGVRWSKFLEWPILYQHCYHWAMIEDVCSRLKFFKCLWRMFGIICKSSDTKHTTQSHCYAIRRYIYANYVKQLHKYIKHFVMTLCRITAACGHLMFHRLQLFVVAAPHTQTQVHRKKPKLYIVVELFTSFAEVTIIFSIRLLLILFSDTIY